MVGFALIVARLYWLQILAADRFVALAQDQRQRVVVLSPQRGSMFDRTGAEMAISMDMKTVFANPRFVGDPALVSKAISPILNLNESEVTAKLSRRSGFVYIARKIDPKLADQVDALHLPGIDTVAESKRLYPSGALASHVMGFVGFDNRGLGGLEQKYDSMLRGTPGEILTERDPQGRPIPVGKNFVKPSAPGQDLILTLDRQVQFTAEVELAKAIKTYNAKGGSIIVMDPKTGDILALANLPTFDPNNVQASSAVDRRNKVFQDAYEPGSANKVITAAAAIENGVAKPSDVFSVPAVFQLGSKLFRDSHPHPTVNMSFSQIIQQSSNVGTIKIALGLGKQRLYDYLTAFGYGRSTDAGYPGEAGGILPKPEKWFGSAIGTIPIGQGVAATPIQVAEVFSTVANGGVALKPRLVEAMIDSAGKRKQASISTGKRVIQRSTADSLTSMLVGVTQGVDGTGRAADIPGYQIAGKTGTAQKPAPGGYSGYMASFFGYAPAGDPKFVVGVVLDNPTPIYGGLTSAVVFKQVMEFCLRRLGIGPGPVLPQEGTPLPALVRSGGAASTRP